MADHTKIEWTDASRNSNSNWHPALPNLPTNPRGRHETEDRYRGSSIHRRAA